MHFLHFLHFRASKVQVVQCHLHYNCLKKFHVTNLTNLTKFR